MFNIWSFMEDNTIRVNSSIFVVGCFECRDTISLKKS